MVSDQTYDGVLSMLPFKVVFLQKDTVLKIPDFPLYGGRLDVPVLTNSAVEVQDLNCPMMSQPKE